MARKAFIITDLGPGDGGKGSVIHKIVTSQDIQTVIKVGGCQGSHGIMLEDGTEFNFHQFGCGTFEGISTYLSELFVVDPITLEIEANELIKNGLENPYDLISIHSECIVAVVFHRFENQLQEIARGKNQRGTVGTGAGTAYEFDERYPEMTIFWKDLPNTQVVTEKLGAICEKVKERIQSIEDSLTGEALSEEDWKEASEMLRLINNPDELIRNTVLRFADIYSRIIPVGEGHLQNILTSPGNILFESSHGVLTDSHYGLVPHVSRLRTLPFRIDDLLKREEYTGQILHFGVCRAFAVRHGEGPMATYNEKFTKEMLDGEKHTNRFQGGTKYGEFDFLALRHAIDICGGSEYFDGICMTWMDKPLKKCEWKYCTKYGSPLPDEIFNRDGSYVPIDSQESETSYEYSLTRTGILKDGVEPIIQRIKLSGNKEDFIQIVNDSLQERLGVKLAMASFGPKDSDKVLI